MGEEPQVAAPEGTDWTWGKPLPQEGVTPRRSGGVVSILGAQVVRAQTEPWPP